MILLFAITLISIIKCDEVCFEPIIANLFGNCYLDGAGTIQCPNEATPNALSLNFTYGSGISNIALYTGESAGMDYIEGGSVVDTDEIIKDAAPKFVGLSFWTDPALVFRINIYNVEFEFQTDNDIIIDDGIISQPIICQKCYTYDSDLIHIMLRISTPDNDQKALFIRMGGKTIYFSEHFTLEYSTTTVVEFEWGSSSEKFFKSSFYVGDGDIPHEVCDTLCSYGPSYLDNVTCFENITCTNYDDLVDCYEEVAEKTALLIAAEALINRTLTLECNETGCNDTLILEKIQQTYDRLDEFASSSQCCFPYVNIEGLCIEITCWNITYNSRLVCSGYGVCTGIDRCECYGDYAGVNCELDGNGTCPTSLEICEQALSEFDIPNWRMWVIIGLLILLLILTIIVLFVICLLNVWGNDYDDDNQKKRT